MQLFRNCWSAPKWVKPPHIDSSFPFYSRRRHAWRELGDGGSCRLHGCHGLAGAGHHGRARARSRRGDQGLLRAKGLRPQMHDRSPAPRRQGLRSDAAFLHPRPLALPQPDGLRLRPARRALQRDRAARTRRPIARQNQGEVRRMRVLPRLPCGAALSAARGAPGGLAQPSGWRGPRTGPCKACQKTD